MSHLCDSGKNHLSSCNLVCQACNKPRLFDADTFECYKCSASGATLTDCMCYKPSVTEINNANVETLNCHRNEEMEKETNIYNSDTIRTVHLTQDDFKYGTYRITKPGTYIIDEDIEFDFNAGDLDDPNAEGLCLYLLLFYSF